MTPRALQPLAGWRINFGSWFTCEADDRQRLQGGCTPETLLRNYPLSIINHKAAEMTIYIYIRRERRETGGIWRFQIYGWRSEVAKRSAGGGGGIVHSSWHWKEGGDILNSGPSARCLCCQLLLNGPRTYRGAALINLPAIQHSFVKDILPCSHIADVPKVWVAGRMRLSWTGYTDRGERNYWKTRQFLIHALGLNNSVAWVREQTIPTERPSLLGEVSANFWGQRGVM
jgi:hypothetical protein